MPETETSSSFPRYLKKRFGFAASREGIVSLIVIGIAAIVFYLTKPYGFVASQIIIVVASAIIFPLRLYYDFRRAENKIDTQQDRIREVETRVEQETEFPEFFQGQINLVAERARLVMVTAEGRANMLYGVGTLLTVLSVLVPFVAVAIYFASDPLSEQTVTTLQSLKKESGDFPDGISIDIQRDWRILLSGISFGFLFIAAAGAIFSQHRRQTQTYLELAKDVDYYDGVASAVEVQNRADHAQLSEGMKSLQQRVITQLLKRETSAEKKETENKSESLETIMARLAQVVKQTGA